MDACRACLIDNNQEMIYLFDDNESMEMFTNCTSLEVNASDQLPTHLCIDCYSKLVDFNRFRKMCIESDSLSKQNNLIKLENDDNIASFDNGNFEYTDSYITDQQEKFICDHCNEVCWTRQQIVEHMEQHVEPKFDFFSDLAENVGKKEQIFGRKLFRINELSQNVEINNKQLAVNVSKKRRQKTRQLESVKRIKSEKFACNYENCNKLYSHSSSLSAHKKFAHIGTLKQLVYCEICGKACLSAFDLRAHKYIHTGEQPFACSLCPKKFRLKYDLKLHVMRHEGVKKFSCNICGAPKTTQKELRRHINTHTKEKKFPCELCSLIFASYGTRFQHIKVIHMASKSFTCDYCNQSFSQKNLLKDHIMRHAVEKPHACLVCESRFTRPYLLRKHMIIHNKHKKVTETTVEI